jgi:aspartate/methionine/tyrosine aminotransferase
VEAPFTDELYARPDADAGALIEAVASPRTRGIYLITPNNPDGKVLTRAQLESVARVARERDLAVIADEVYADYTFDGRPHVSMARLSGMASRTVTAFSFSKSHALAGARVGAVVGPEPIVTAAKRVSVHSAFNVPEAMQHVALEALAEDASFIAGARATYCAARDTAARALAGAPCRFAPAEGGVYLFLDFAELLGDRPLSALLERAVGRGVLLAPGDAFGDRYATCARLCTSAVEPARLLEGISRLRTAMTDLT